MSFLLKCWGVPENVVLRLPGMAGLVTRRVAADDFHVAECTVYHSSQIMQQHAIARSTGVDSRTSGSTGSHHQFVAGL